MKNLFKVTIKIGETEQTELFFDNQDRAERFIEATSKMLTSKGKKELEFVAQIVSVIDCDEDVTNAYSSALGENPKQ